MFLRQNLAPLLFNLFLFRKSPNFDDFSETERLKDVPIDFNRVRCPLCRWQPRASSRWYCSDSGLRSGCGTEWNTFDTRGRCPGCNFQWLWTDCLRCCRASLHRAWYESEIE